MKCTLSLLGVNVEQAMLGVLDSDLQVAFPPPSITGLQHLSLAAFFKWAKLPFWLNPNSASIYFCKQYFFLSN